MSSKNHVPFDREEASRLFPGTQRYVCPACKFSTDNPDKASAHQAWIKSKQEERR